ncbi:hypothetical protein SAMN02746065_1065 [Desulfocicer vacuolatum DSM 3385]|uniref:Uncharacterized protein n=1 Tax=Desulfocicer vacuolatum DSM 3385 TaxID=1121400 RepID=A0A1W2APX6_9BACT|nr:hypothetical protein [Desulfocicer vacuolatum]SMC62779.1 hypothetical protein SAMN02746065_1065 [Desulfocicer vacuolatum DSM 3385]
MKVLHILKSPPDEKMRKLFEKISKDTVVSVVELYDENLDWQALVNDMLEHDQIVCWE